MVVGRGDSDDAQVTIAAVGPALVIGDESADGVAIESVDARTLAGDMAGAAGELRKWIRAGGRVLPGLVLRREAEVALLKVKPTMPSAHF